MAVDSLSALESLLAQIGKTWEQFVEEIDVFSGYSEKTVDPHWGQFDWQTHIPAEMIAVWDHLPIEAQCAFYYEANRDAIRASDAYGDALDRGL